MKKTLTTTTALLAGIASATANPAIFAEVSQHFHEIRLLTAPSNYNQQAGQIFAKIEKSTQAMNELNSQVSTIADHITALDFPFLQALNELSQFTLAILKQQYPNEIRGEFYSLFRLFSGECFRLNGLIVGIKERLFGAEVISIEGLTLSQQELDEISREASERWRKLEQQAQGARAS